MTSLSTITVATDLSARSERAVARAVALAQAHQAALTVLHVVDADLPEDLEAAMLEKSRANLEALVPAAVAGRDVTITCLAGDPVEEMIRAAQAAPDLFIVGIHRARLFLDALRETTVQKTVRHAPCAVLLVARAVDGDYASVLCPTDFSPAASRALEVAAHLAPQARFRPFNAMQVPYSGRLQRSPDVAKQLEAAFQKDATAAASTWLGGLALAGIDCEQVSLLSGGPLAVISRAVEDHGADLIAVGAHGRVGAMPAVLGSVANDLIRDPPCDILIAR